jgi:hypothetical protein
VSIEVEGLAPLAADMRAATDRLRKDIGQVVSKGALNIKQQIRNDFRASSYFGKTGIVSTIKYNRKDTADSIEAEIAPYLDNDGTGGLTGIAIHGGSRGGGGTVADPIHALQAEAPNFTEALAALAGTVLDG